jgi:hypothetical protein
MQEHLNNILLGVSYVKTKFDRKHKQLYEKVKVQDKNITEQEARGEKRVKELTERISGV